MANEIELTNKPTEEEFKIILKGFKLCDQYGYKINVNVKDQVNKDFVELVSNNL